MRYLILSMFFIISACSFIPQYSKPDAPIPKDFPKDGVYSNIDYDNTTQISELKWQEFFTDPKMKRVIEMALKNNRDLRLAILNMEAARMMYGIKRAEIYPSIYGSAGASKSRVSDDFSPTGKGYEKEQYNLNLGLAEWEIDFFGRIRSMKESALEQFFASRENRRAAQIAIISEVSRCFLSLASDMENYRIVSELYNTVLQNYKMVEEQYRVGLATEIDLNRAKIALDSVKVSLANLEQVIEKGKNALNLVVGMKVEKELLPDGLFSIVPIREFSPNITSDVLLNRPDIMAAEHQLRAANANIGAARAAIFPRISLLAGVGVASSDLNGLFNAGSRVWNFGSNVSMPIFDARVWQEYELSKIQKELYITQYEKAIQTAFREVMDTLAVRATVENQLNAQKELMNSLQRNYDLANQMFNQGVENYFTVLDATKNLLQAKQTLTNLEYLKMLNKVQMYTVLGGGGDYDEEKELKNVKKN